MRPRHLAAVGLGLSALMQLVFVLTGLERGGAYVALHVAAFLGSAAAAWGLWRAGRRGLAALSAGLWTNAVARLLFGVLGLTRFPAWLNVTLFAGYLAAAAFATLWAAQPYRGRERAAGLRLAAWLVAATYFVAAYRALGNGALAAAFALLLGCVGFFLAAPNAEPDLPAAG